MTDERKSGSLLIILACLVAVALVAPPIIGALLLRGGEPLCFGRRCAVLTMRGSYFVTQLSESASDGGAPVRLYDVGSHVIRREFDTDHDGVYDCRDECGSAGHDSSACISHLVGGSWTSDPLGTFDCSGGRDVNFWPDAGF